MEFKRKKRVAGRTQKTYREWWSEDGRYRIHWRATTGGVAVEPAYHACVRCWASHSQREYWGFAGRRGVYKTLKAAIAACALNERTWNKFLTIEGRAKVSQIRDLDSRSTVGIGKSAFSLLTELPCWVVEAANPRLIELLVRPPRNGGEE